MSSDASIIVKNLTELLSNSVNVNSFLYDLLVNPEPMDVTVKRYNSDGIIEDIVIPNRAKDNVTVTSGEGSPEGVFSAIEGSFYIDTLNNFIYFKTSNEVNTGWVSLLTDSTVTSLLEKSIQLSKDWANKENETVDGVEYSAKHYSGVSKDFSQEAKDWANKENETVDGTEYSAKYYSRMSKSHSDEAKSFSEISSKYAETSRVNAETSKKHAEESKNFAETSKAHSDTSKSNSDISKDYSDLSKDWANKEVETVDGVEYSAKYYSNLAKGHSDEAKAMSEEAGSYVDVVKEQVNLSKEQALSSKSSSDLSKDWANKEVDTVDGAEYSAKYYANKAKDNANESKSFSTLAKNYSDTSKVYSDEAGSHSSTSKGYSDLSKDWANKEVDTVDGKEYSAKYYSNLAKGYSDKIKEGSDISSAHVQEAKDWANKENDTVDGVEYSAKYYSNLAKNSSNLAEGCYQASQSYSEEAKTAAQSAKENSDKTISSCETAKNWAIKEGAPVDGTEYSAKHYSNESKGFVISAKGYAEDAKVQADSVKGQASIVQKYSDDAKGYADEAKVTLESVSDSVQLSKDWATKDSGTVDGLDYSSKYYAKLSRKYSETSKASASWGKIKGNLTDQKDLSTSLEAKGDGLLYENGLLYLTSNGVKISEGIKVSQSGGGGGGGGDSFKLTTITEPELSIAYGVPLLIEYTYLSTQNDPATVQYIVNNETKDSQRINKNGDVSYDITKFLIEGLNFVQVKVIDTYGNTRSLLYTINTISLKIKSDFDSSLIYNSDITFRYTPIGAIDKTIHFLIDGEETTELVSSSGRQLTKILKFTHGVHSLKVWATATVDMSEIKSNELFYEILYADGDTPLISSEFIERDYLQGETVSIPYNVYTPNSMTSKVDILMNDKVMSSMVVDRTRQIWSRNIDITGPVKLSIVSGSARRDFNINVNSVEIDVTPVEENLELYLTANGRNNNDLDREVWEDKGVKCVLTGFNFVNNGWINNSLKVSNGAHVTVPVKIFEKDFRSNGKTIEFEFSTSNVLDYDSIVINCMNDRGFYVGAQSAALKSEQSEVKVKFKEEEKVRVSFVIENKSSNRLIYTYLNGILSGLDQYPEDDDFHQVTPLNIEIGSDTCDVNIYNIRIYDSFLSSRDILDNFIYDTADINEKLDLYTRNNIYDAYGNILYNKILNQVPIMTITGDLPKAKGDKKKVSVNYEDAKDASRNFNMDHVTIDVQGTSSQYYPKKNYKISKLPVAYKIRPNAVPEKKFTLKADYMESSHAHNTGLAKLVNNLYDTKTPPQKRDDRIRTTIDGFPIALYYKKDSITPAVYFGIYNFNNDKGNNDTFGFVDGCESWEIRNNTSARCLFKSDDFSDRANFLKDFEARFPDESTDTFNLEILISWIVSCDASAATDEPIPPETLDGVLYSTDSAEYRTAKFKVQCPEHFNMDFLITYYIVSELFGMVDSRAKNMFMNMYGDGIWYPVFYDLDTCIGLNNEGENNFGFNIEYHDTIGTKSVFNGEKSTLWNMVEKVFSSEIKDTYNRYRNEGKLSYEKAMDIFYGEQISKICEAQYNEDAEFKYLSPLLDEGIATYLYTAQGSRLDHIKWWLYNRFNYLDSKYVASDYKDNYITLRLYTPDKWSEVEPNANITLTPYADQYVRIRYGSYDVYERAEHDVPTTIVPPKIIFNDTETIIYGASKLNSLGNLAPLYAGTIDVSKGVKLSELLIGAGGTYKNTNLKELTLGNNTLLKKIDVRNCPSLRNALDVSGCSNLEELDATGTSITSVKLAPAGSIKKLLLPETITNLTVKNQNKIEQFTCGHHMGTIVIENSNLDSKAIFEGSNPTKVRFIGIDWTLNDFSLLDRVYDLLGIDENGYNTAHGVITGTIRMSNQLESVVNKYREKFIGLDFIVTPYAVEDAIRTDDGVTITTDKGEVFLYT